MYKPPASLFCFLIIFLFPHSPRAETLGPRTLPALSPDDISLLVTTPDPVKNLDPTNPTSHLSKILIPRTPATENHTLVKNYIITTLNKLDWHTEVDAFTSQTPLGPKRFANIIATKDPSSSRRVVVSAHYDSKYFATYPDNQFVGATDSAASCAMLLDLAEALNPHLDERKKRIGNNIDDEDEDVADITLRLVFFDGEEAFLDWTDQDSLYGARHLASEWESKYILSDSKRKLMDYAKTELSTIEHLILLDLLGSAQPRIRAHFLDTAWLFDALVSVERRLGDGGAFTYGVEQGLAPEQWKSYFVQRSTNSVNFDFIGDDHVPFLRKGVSVLHIIPEPFPLVWHTLRDDASALDVPTMRRWNVIFRVFMSEYLHLFPSSSAKAELHKKAITDHFGEETLFGSHGEAGGKAVAGSKKLDIGHPEYVEPFILKTQMANFLRICNKLASQRR